MFLFSLLMRMQVVSHTFCLTHPSQLLSTSKKPLEDYQYVKIYCQENGAKPQQNQCFLPP
jgi:hypothetical protein